MQAVAQSPFAPLLLTAEKTFNYLEKKANLCGFRDAEEFFNKPIDPQTGQPLQPPPPPKPESVQVAEIKAQTDQQALQAKGQMDMQAKQVDVQVEQQKMQMDAQREAAQAQADMAVEQQKAQLTLQLEREKMAAEMAFKREELAMEYQFKQWEAQMNLQMQREAKQMEIGAQKEIAQFNGHVAAHTAEVGAKAKADSDAKKKPEAKQPDLTGPLQEAIKALGAAAGNKKILRGPDGKATGTAPA
jgi:hypothetical protein